jgi:hypothetical protein
MDHPVSGLIRQGNLRANRSNPHRSKATLLEFLSTAAGTRVGSPDAFERGFKVLALDTVRLSLLPPPLLVLAVLFGEAVPSGQFFDRVTEKRVLATLHEQRIRARSPEAVTAAETRRSTSWR